MAWMHEPVHLHCAFVPRFVVRMLEAALHGYLCTAEKAFLTLVELQRQGKLQPWPEAAERPERPERPRRRPAPRYRMKFAAEITAVAPAMLEAGLPEEQCSAQVVAVAVAAQASIAPEAKRPASVARAGMAAREQVSVLAAQRAAESPWSEGRLHTYPPPFAPVAASVPVPVPGARAAAGCWRAWDRCREAMVFRAFGARVETCA